MQAVAHVVILMLACWMGSAAAQGKNVSALAPEFPTGLQWLNTERPLTLRELRGKVVLLEFWTYGCINCLHILPDLHRLEAKYARQLVVIGVHSAKYDNEAVLANIRQATQRYGITHPVVHDQDYRIWNAYRVTGWPTQILIDPEGRQLQGYAGENHYERLDRLIASTVALHRRKGALREDTLDRLTSVRNTTLTPLRYPGKVLADAASSRLFIADSYHHRLVVTDLQGNLQTVIGRGVPGAADGPFETASFDQPQGMALHGGMLYVADTGNHLLRRIDLQRRLVQTVAGTGEKARVFNVPGIGRAVPLNSPWDVYRQGQYLYIAMAGMHQLWRMDLQTSYVEPFSGTGREDLIDEVHTEAALGQPSGLTGDGQRLYVADSEVNAVRAASLDPDGTLATLAGGGLFTFGDQDGRGDAVRLQHPLGVAYANGVVYVADTYNHKVKQLDLRSRQIQTLAGTGSAGHRDGALGQAQFYEPGGLSVSGGRLYIADTNNHTIRVIDLATQRVLTLVVRGLTAPAIVTSEPTTPDYIEVVRLEEQALPATMSATLRIALELTADWKINAAAPASLVIKSEGEGVQVPTRYANRTLRPLASEFTVPLQVAEDGTRSLLRVDLTFVVCRAGDQGICALQQVAWEVPVLSQTQATQSEVILPYTVVPF